MHRTQTCTMAEFVWLLIHLENLQLRLFSYKTYVHTHAPTHTCTNTYTHTHLRTHALTHTHTRTYAHMH